MTLDAHALASLEAALELAGEAPRDRDGYLTAEGRSLVQAALAVAGRDGPAHDWDAMSEADWASFKADDWQPYTLTRGPNKGKSVWKNSRTGAISHEDPAEKKKKQDEAAAAKKKQAQAAAAAKAKARAAAVAAKQKAKEAAAKAKEQAAARKKASQEKAVEHIGAMIRGELKPTTVGVRSLGAVLLTMTGPQLQALKKQIGAKGSGAKAALVQAILERAKGAGKPAQTGTPRVAAAPSKPAAPKRPAKPAAPPPPPPPKREPFKPGQPLTRDALRERVAGLSDTDRLVELRTVMNEAAVDHGTLHVHGMTTPEAMKGVTVDGVKVSWSEGAPAQRSLESLLKPIPPAVWEATKHIVLTGQANKDDDYWKQVYNDPTHTSAATGGDGTVCIYRGNPVGQPTLAHEGGHNFATVRWGSVHPPLDSDYRRAMEQEGPVSFYSQSSNSAAEDFAEAVRRYSEPVHMFRQIFKDKFPKKFAAVEALLGPWEPLRAPPPGKP